LIVTIMWESMAIRKPEVTADRQPKKAKVGKISLADHPDTKRMNAEMAEAARVRAAADIEERANAEGSSSTRRGRSRGGHSAVWAGGSRR
jgi:hypothetical protein